MIFRACIALMVLFALAAGCFAAEKKPIDDGLIADQVGIKLANDQVVKGGAIKVEAKEGVVTLTGQVASQKQKDRATKLAGKVKGVKRVINNINLRDQKASR